MSRRISPSALALCCALGPAIARGDTLEVGPGKPYAAPCQAFSAASPGDVVEIDADGDYDGDVCAFDVDELTIRGVGGRATVDATGTVIPNQKAIRVIQGDDAVVESVAFVGASVPDHNGAGIRQEGTNLTVRNCAFVDNEMGILAGDNAQSEILIEYSEFGGNGFGDGLSHNFYINHVAKLTLRYSYSHSAHIGHLAKTRAHENYILYNRLTGEDGTQSYELDVPNAGRTYVIGNLFHQGPNTDNGGFLSYGAEGPDNPSDELFVVNNTFVNERSGGTFLNIDSRVSTAVVVRNNIFFGSGTIVTQGSALVEASCTDDPLFVSPSSFDYRLGSASSPCVDAGVEPGMGAGLSLEPTHHYVHPAGEQGRTPVSTIDIGAYELGGGVAGSGGQGGGGGGSGGSGAADGGSGGGAADGGSGGSAAGSADGSEDEGCGCRMSAAPGSAWGGLLALMALALLGRRWRRE